MATNLLLFITGIVIGLYLYRVEGLIRSVAKWCKVIAQQSKHDKGIVQTLKPINKPKETDHVVRSFNPKQVAAETQRRFEERNTL